MVENRSENLTPLLQSQIEIEDQFKASVDSVLMEFEAKFASKIQGDDNLKLQAAKRVFTQISSAIRIAMGVDLSDFGYADSAIERLDLEGFKQKLSDLATHYKGAEQDSYAHDGKGEGTVTSFNDFQRENYYALIFRYLERLNQIL